MGAKAFSRWRQWSGLTLVVAMLALLCSCGGGGTSFAGVDSGGTGGGVTTLASGPVNGLGSAIVDGVRFDIANASIVDEDGDPITESQISMGMVARIESSSVVTANGQSTATAATMVIRSQLVGPVDSVNVAGNELVMLGQTIAITPATWFDSSLSGGFSSALVGEIIEVYGQYDRNRNIYVATRIAEHLDHSAYKIAGVLNAVDTTAHTLTVGGQSVSYALLAPANVPTLTVGDFVRVKVGTLQIGGVWRALAVAVARTDLPDRREVRVRGRIGKWASTRSFHVDGVQVDAASATFVGTESNAVLGARVTVVGASSGGVMHATQVTIDGDETSLNSQFELHGTVSSFNGGAQTLSVHGLTVSYTGSTTYQGGVVSDLANGKKIKVLGVIAADRISVTAQSIAFE